MSEQNLIVEGYEDIIVDRVKLNRIQFKIMALEHKNLKTKEYTKSQMITEIMKIISEEVNKNI